MTACPREGCQGTIDADGFCDTCGLEAPDTPPAATVAVAAPQKAAKSAEKVDSGPTTTRTGTVRTGSVATSWTAPTGAVSSVSRRGSARSSSRGLLGAGLVEIPRVPYRDPKSAVLTDP